VISHPPDAADYFLLLLCVRIKLFRCRFVPLLGPNPGNFILSQDQTPSVLARFARSGSQSRVPLHPPTNIRLPGPQPACAITRCPIVRSSLAISSPHCCSTTLTTHSANDRGLQKRSPLAVLSVASFRGAGGLRTPKDCELAYCAVAGMPGDEGML